MSGQATWIRSRTTRLSRASLGVEVGSLGETEALIARFHLEGHARSTLEEAWLLEHLAKDEGLSLEELGHRLCRTKSWVSRRLGLRKVLTSEVQDKVAAGQIPAQAAMKYLLPLARANAEHARTLVAGLCTQRVSVRQMGKHPIPSPEHPDASPAHRRLSLVGPPGVGKTGIATGLLLRALESGYRGRFLRAQDLFDELYASLADRSTRKLLDSLARVDVLLVDEMG